MREASAKRTTARPPPQAPSRARRQARVDEPGPSRAAGPPRTPSVRQGGARDPAGESCIREECHRDARECPVHRPTLEPLRVYLDPARSFTGVNDRRHLTHSARRRTMRGRCTATQRSTMTDHPIPVEGAHAGWGSNGSASGRASRQVIVARAALPVAAYILPGAEVKGFLGAVVAAAVIALLNALLPPFIARAPAPFMLVFGFLAILVLDAVMLLAADRPTDGDLSVDGFWWAPRRARAVGGHARDRGRPGRRRQRVLVLRSSSGSRARPASRPAPTRPGSCSSRSTGFALPVLRRVR